MNRNHQNRNTVHHTHRGRNHVARRQLGPGFHTPMASNPAEERNVRYSTATFWSEKDYPFMEQGKSSYDAPERSRSSNYVDSDIDPVEIRAKDFLRHGKSYDRDHDNHGREFSYRAKSYFAELDEENFDPSSSFAGFGPKSYVRSDALIEEEICEALKNDIYIDASDITVSVEKGVVKLFGSVPARHHKFDIEDDAEKVAGVVEVQNDIRVNKANFR